MNPNFIEYLVLFILGAVAILLVVGWFYSPKTRKLTKFALIIFFILILLLLIGVIIRRVLFPFPHI